MATVGEFYKRWEGVEARLIEIKISPVLALRSVADRYLTSLYQLKQELDDANFEPDRKIRGIHTDSSGVVSFEGIEEFARDYHRCSGIKYLESRGAVL